MKLLHTWNMLIIEQDIGFVYSTFHRSVCNFEAAGLPLKWLDFIWNIASIRWSYAELQVAFTSARNVNCKYHINSSW